jgi:uncharacterized membrane protein YkoI
MKKIALVAAGAATLGGGAAVVATTATAASSADAGRAVQTASRGIPHKAFDLDRERYRWEVEFADGTERHVSLDGRRVIATHRDDDRSSRAASARVSLGSALLAAGPRADGTLTDAELDTERGTLVWSVGFEGSGDRETEVSVDARSGRVLRVNQDDD